MGTPRRGGGRCWRPLLVVLALLGLLWMHGLGTHGTVEPAAAADTVTHGAHQDPAASEEDHGGAGGHGGHVMAAGLCLALLLAAALLTGRWRRGLLLRLRDLTRTLSTGLAPPAPRARPPDLVALGVCRC